MLLRVYADSPADFAAWIKQQQHPAMQIPAASSGRAVFEANACINCHTISGTSAHGTFGPNLSHLASRDTIASGAVPNNAQNLRAFIDNPAHFKPGALMPAMQLNAHDLDAVTAISHDASLRFERTRSPWQRKLKSHSQSGTPTLLALLRCCTTGLPPSTIRRSA